MPKGILDPPLIAAVSDVSANGTNYDNLFTAPQTHLFYVPQDQESVTNTTYVDISHYITNGSWDSKFIGPGIGVEYITGKNVNLK